ncbi:hypothetical protein EYR40_007020 [Pleurotus pulmonarius]|nr:hypothetical protein EYR36_003704 [Pleurotus pulmonarius]KAF4599916.1 hypothetical protein EYR40_007020 [Pleurotus pulmonarius]
MDITMGITMDMNTLSALKRNELQKLAMAHSIKANQKSATLIALLLAKHGRADAHEDEPDHEQEGEGEVEVEKGEGKGEQTNVRKEKEKGKGRERPVRAATKETGTTRKRGRAAADEGKDDANTGANEVDDAQPAPTSQGRESPGPSKRLRPRRGQPVPAPSKAPPPRPLRSKATVSALIAPAPAPVTVTVMGPPPPPPPPNHLPPPLPFSQPRIPHAGPHCTPPHRTPAPPTRYSPTSTPSVVSAHSRHYTPTPTPTASFVGAGTRFRRFPNHTYGDDDGGGGSSAAPPTLARRKSSRIPRHAEIANMSMSGVHGGKGRQPSPPSPTPAKPRNSLLSQRLIASALSESLEEDRASEGDAGPVELREVDGKIIKKLVLVVKQEEDSDDEELELPGPPHARGVSKDKGKERERHGETIAEGEEAAVAAQAERRPTPRSHERGERQGANWGTPLYSPSSPPYVVPDPYIPTSFPPTPDHEFHRESTPEAAVGQGGGQAPPQPQPQPQLEQHNQIAAWAGATRVPSRSPSYGFTTPTHSPRPSLYSPSVSPASPRPPNSHYISPPASPGMVHETVALLRVIHDRNAALHDQVAELRTEAQNVRAQAELLVERLRAEKGEVRRMDAFTRYWRGGGYYNARGVGADPGYGVTEAARESGLGEDVAGLARNRGVNGNGGTRTEWRPSENWLHEEVWGGQMQVLRALVPEEQIEITSEDEWEGGILDRIDNGDDVGIGMQRMRGEEGVFDTLGVGAEVPAEYLEAQRREEEAERERARLEEEEMLKLREEEDMLERKRENQRAAKGKRKADDPVDKEEERTKRKKIFSQV